MQQHSDWLWPVAILLLVVVVVGGYSLYRRLTASIEADVPEGPATAVTTHLQPPPAAEETEVAQRLLAAGLNEEPVLGDTAVSRHRQRLEGGEISEETLLQYADDLAYLNRFTAENGGRIPTSFWDVRTEMMEAKKWDEYSIVRQISIPEAEPYLLLLSKGFGRFRSFKEAEQSGEDTALDAALDLFAFANEYQNAITPPGPADSPEEIEDRARAQLMVWQSLVAGSTRTNPLTGKPLYSHGIFARDNVGTMHQYDQGRAMSISEVWGVTGFASKYVGIPENANQIEHMSISMVLQTVMDEPVAVLDGIEEEGVLAGHAHQAEARADMALNNAIHRHFVHVFAGDWNQAVEQLRRVLKDE